MEKRVRLSYPDTIHNHVMLPHTHSHMPADKHTHTSARDKMYLEGVIIERYGNDCSGMAGSSLEVEDWEVMRMVER